MWRTLLKADPCYDVPRFFLLMAEGLTERIPQASMLFLEARRFGVDRGILEEAIMESDVRVVGLTRAHCGKLVKCQPPRRDGG
jgi:hypothetical protein